MDRYLEENAEARVCLHAEVGCGELEGSGEIALYGELPRLGVANAKVRIDGKGIGSGRDTGIEAVRQG